MSSSRMASRPGLSRRAVQTEVSRLISRLAPGKERLVAATRRWLRKRLPTAHEVVYAYPTALVISFSPTGHGYEGVFAIRADADGVKLYFNQARGLPDPGKLLRGSGKQARALPLDGAATLALPAVARLFEDAMARNPVPFADTGDGSVILRSKTGS